MIKTEHGVLTAKGSIVELLADLSVIIYGLNKMLLDKVYKEAFTEPKTEKKAETKGLQELLNQLAKILSE